MSDFIIRSLTFQLDGSVAIEYVRQRDFKQNGLQIHHVVLIPGDSDYDDEITAVREAAEAALVDALEDLETAEPFDFSKDDDDDTDDDD